MLLCPASQNEAHLSGSTRTPWRVHEQVSLHNVTRCAHAYRFLGPIGGSHSCLGIWLAVVHFTTVIWDEWWRVRRCNRKGAENGGKTLQSVSMDPVKECRHGDARPVGLSTETSVRKTLPAKLNNNQNKIFSQVFLSVFVLCVFRCSTLVKSKAAWLHREICCY